MGVESASGRLPTEVGPQVAVLPPIDVCVCRRQTPKAAEPPPRSLLSHSIGRDLSSAQASASALIWRLRSSIRPTRYRARNSRLTSVPIGPTGERNEIRSVIRVPESVGSKRWTCLKVENGPLTCRSVKLRTIRRNPRHAKGNAEVCRSPGDGFAHTDQA